MSDEHIFTPAQQLQVEAVVRSALDKAYARCPTVRAMEQIQQQVTEIHVALMGNGSPEDGLLIRVRDLERRANVRRAAWKVWADRAWRLIQGAALLAIGYLVLAKL